MSNKLRMLLIVIALTIIFLLGIGIISTEQIPPLNSVAFDKLMYGLKNPDFSIYLEGNRYIIETIAIALLGTIFSMIIALPIALKSSYKINKNYKRWNYISPLIRIFPDLLIGIFIVSIVGPGSWAGVLTIAIVSCGTSIKFFKEIINKNDNQSFTYAKQITKSSFLGNYLVVIGLNINEILANALTRLESNLRIAVIIGFVGAGGVGNVLLHSIQTYDFETAFALIYVLMILFIILDYVAAHIRKKLR